MISTCNSLRRHFSTVSLKKDTNQAYGIAKFAVDFLKNGKPSHQVYTRLKLLHTDSIICGFNTLSTKANSPSIFKNEALLNVKKGGKANRPKIGMSKVFGSWDGCPAEKAITANVSAISELSNNSVFLGHNKGDIVYNDFYPVVVACAQQNVALTGEKVAKGMVLLNEIQERLCEAFPLSPHKVDPVLYGAIASTVTYGALMGATPNQIENAMSILITHNIPTLAAAQGKQISDLQGASSAILVEAAIGAIRRAHGGLMGPQDIFRSPYGIFRMLETTNGNSPFDLNLTMEGNNFSIMKNHFRLGSYSIHAAGAIEGVLKLLKENKFLVLDDPDCIESIKIITYKSAVNTIGGEAKKSPQTRQTALNSIYYIVANLLQKGLVQPDFNDKEWKTIDELWRALPLTPNDYSASALNNPVTSMLMKKVSCEAGGKEFDEKFPDGCPTIVRIKLRDGRELDSGLIIYPAGHIKNTQSNLKHLLDHKVELLGKSCVGPTELKKLIEKLEVLDELTNAELQTIYCSPIKYTDKSIEDFS